MCLERIIEERKPFSTIVDIRRLHVEDIEQRNLQMYPLTKVFENIKRQNLHKCIHTYPLISITSFLNDPVRGKNFYRLSSAMVTEKSTYRSTNYSNSKK